MANVELVIKIPQDTVDEIKDNAMFAGIIPSEILWDVTSAIVKGIPIPKGHGRLIDESDLMPDSDYEDGTFYAVSIEQINSTPTIIEADMAERMDT